VRILVSEVSPPHEGTIDPPDVRSKSRRMMANIKEFIEEFKSQRSLGTGPCREDYEDSREK
jgi:hypothetical protein